MLGIGLSILLSRFLPVRQRYHLLSLIAYFQFYYLDSTRSSGLMALAEQRCFQFYYLDSRKDEATVTHGEGQLSILLSRFRELSEMLGKRVFITFNSII